jgi:hypothetical protein
MRPKLIGDLAGPLIQVSQELRPGLLIKGVVVANWDAEFGVPASILTESVHQNFSFVILIAG